MGVGEARQQRDHAAGRKRQRHGVAGDRDRQPEHGEDAAADHAADADGGDLGEAQLAFG